MLRFTDTIETVAARIIGRRRELEMILAVLEAGRDILLEGPPGTSKTTLLREIASAAAVPLEIVEGAPDLLPAKLVGGHDPALVLGQGYRPEAFVDGPLLRAMRNGGILYVEEFNRIPEDVTNVLIRALSERRIVVPRMGEFAAAAPFRVIAAMNPYDDTGTERVSRAIGDRFCKVRMTYQTQSEEEAIVHLRLPEAAPELVRLGVAIGRRTREHPHIRMGASIRGAMDFAAVTGRLLEVRRCRLEEAPTDLLLEGVLLAFSSKIWMKPSTELAAEDVLREILLALLGEQTAHLPGSEEPGGPLDGGGMIGTSGASRSGHPKGRAQAQPLETGRAELMSFGGGFARSLDDPSSPLGAHRRFISMAGLGARPVLRGSALKDIEAALELMGGMKLNDRLFLSRRRGWRGPLRLQAGHHPGADLDLDGTLEQWAQGTFRFAALGRSRQPRAFSLILDVSGSMAGPSLVGAAVMAAVLAEHWRRLEHAVVAFSERAVILKNLGDRVPTPGLLRRLTRLHAFGTTNISSGLLEGLTALSRSRTRDRVGILITDGAHNHTSDPKRVASTFPMLHVVGYRPPWERAGSLCRELASQGRGACVLIDQLEQMPHAIATCLEH